MIPIKCYTCGNLLSSKENIHRTIEHVLNNKSTEELINYLKLPNYCCNIYFIDLHSKLKDLPIEQLENIHKEFHE